MTSADVAGAAPGALSSPALTVDEAMQRAGWLAERVRSRRSETERLRRVPDATIEDFVRSDLLRMNQARRWGGHELGCGAVVELVSRVAEGDASAGWVFGLLASHFWLGSVFGDALQDEMWGDDPTTMMSSSFAARESVVSLEGDGVRISGRWPYSSGAVHCRWVMLGVVVPPGPDRDVPLARWCILPRSDYRIDDEWDTCALRGTASDTIVVDNAFVPAHRSADPALIIGGDGPGRSSNTGPVFALPFAAALGWYLGATALGAATRVVEDFAGNCAAKRSTFTGQSVVDDPLLVHIGSVSAHVEAARAIMRYRCRAIDEVLVRGGVLSRADTLASGRDATSAVRLCVEAVDEAMRFSGAAGLALANPVQQGWRDVHGVSAHMGFNTDMTYGLCGRTLLGLPLPPGFF